MPIGIRATSISSAGVASSCSRLSLAGIAICLLTGIPMVIILSVLAV
jgi:hypothetical protein